MAAEIMHAREARNGEAEFGTQGFRSQGLFLTTLLTSIIIERSLVLMSRLSRCFLTSTNAPFPPHTHTHLNTKTNRAQPN